MGSFGGSVWGGNGSGSNVIAVTLGDLIKPALRRAGITILPGTTPSIDQYEEIIPEVNRMYGSWNCSGLNIYTTNIATYTLTPNQLVYTIGPGGDFDAPRPQKIKQAVLIYPNNVRLPPMYLMTDEDWANVALQVVPNTIPLALYNDGGFPLSNLYLWGQAAQAYTLELYTWLALSPTFTDVSDAVVLPNGYEAAIVDNLAMSVIRLYPLESKLNTYQREDLRKAAMKSLGAVQSLNQTPPNRMVTDAPNGRSSGAGHFDWRIGMNR